MAAYPLTEHEATVNGGATWDAEIISIDLTTAKVLVGNVAKAAGQVGVRVKAASGRNPSPTLWNTVPYTAQASTNLPIISALTAGGYPQVGHELKATYTYSDADGDLEQASTYQWFRADYDAGTNKAAIAGATAKKYQLTPADELKYISVRVTPKDASGATGAPLESPFVQVYAEPNLSETASFNTTGLVTGGAGFAYKLNGSNVGVTASRGFTGDGYIQWKAYNSATYGNSAALSNALPINYAAAELDFKATHSNTNGGGYTLRRSGTIDASYALYTDGVYRLRRRDTKITFEAAPTEAGPWVVIHTYTVTSPATENLYFKVAPEGNGVGVSEAKICSNAFTNTVYA